MFKYSFALSISLIPSYSSSAINLSLNVLFALSTFGFPTATLVVTNSMPKVSQIIPNCVVSTLFLLLEKEFLLSVFIFKGMP